MAMLQKIVAESQWADLRQLLALYPICPTCALERKELARVAAANGHVTSVVQILELEEHGHSPNHTAATKG